MYQRPTAFRRCFAPCIGHILDGKVYTGLPELAVSTPDDPLAWPAFGTDTFYRPTGGLCGFVFRDCGTDLERVGPTLDETMLLAVVGQILNKFSQLVDDGVYVTDFRLSNLVCIPPSRSDASECPRVWFVDTASIANGQNRPASSFAILAVHFRDQLFDLLPLASALRAFTTIYATNEPVLSLDMPLGLPMSLSVKLAVAQLCRFSPVRLHCAAPGHVRPPNSKFSAPGLSTILCKD